MDIKDTNDSSINSNINEGKFINESFGSLNYRDLIKISTLHFEQKVCKLKIELKDGETNFASGFFCYIPSKEMTIFITNNHAIDQNYLENKTEINYLIENNGKEEERTISLKSKRFMLINKELGITIIEIIDEDNIENFFEVDEKFIKNQAFKDKNIFSIQFYKGQNVNICLGKVLKYSCNFIENNIGNVLGSSWAPIITIDEMKIIDFKKAVGINQTKIK